MSADAAERLRERAAYEINTIYADDPEMLDSCHGLACDVLATIVEELGVTHGMTDPEMYAALSTLLRASRTEGER